MNTAAGKLRVLFVRPTLAQGGADKVTVTVLKHLDRARFEPHLALLRAEGEWLDQVPSDVGLHMLDVHRARAMVPALVRLARRLKPDVLFSTSSGTNAIAVLVGRLSGCKVVVSERNIILNGGMRPQILVQWGLKALSYRFAHQVTAVSAGVADDMSRKLWLPREHIRALLNPTVGPETLKQAQEPLDHAWLQPGNSTVVAAGRLVTWKGYPLLLQAFQRVYQLHPESRLLILGEGPELARLQQLAEELGVCPVVEFVGFKKNPFAYFSRAAVFAMASYNEGLPNVLIEAMSCGVPVVATDCPPGMAEIVADGVDGYLVPVGDGAAFAAQLTTLIGNRVLAQRFASAARQSALRFSIANVIGNYEAAILAA